MRLVHQFGIIAAALLFLMAAAPAPAEAIVDPRDQDAALQARKNGELLGLDDIREQVGRRVGGRFLGCDCDPHSGRYRMKYLRGGKVVMVDVDARTGDILRISE
ncbi:hypothetical protein B5C34_09495 [Pacificimonas flava]|uniref:PepSY domain-containing protein n=2 Tax=Pacificimonas TaxID=1960290 RepID=A0A219B5L4_9SPHN|nr:hypothetical protein B5C34_09495 [Pacificimonas flava]